MIPFCGTVNQVNCTTVSFNGLAVILWTLGGCLCPVGPGGGGGGGGGGVGRRDRGVLRSARR